MTTEEVIAAVKRIKEIAGDDEVAHSKEDDLYIAVLRAIEAGIGDSPDALAREALKATDINFERWCA